jgi:membrane-bound lytic murein transglycosylase MltF
LTGFRKEELCPATQEYLKMVVDKRGVVPDDLHTDWKQGFGRDISGQNKYNNYIKTASTKNNIDALILKSLIAQESNFDPKANNSFGFAGLTQIGGAAIQDAGLNIGTTKKTYGIWKFDFDNDERFKPEKSINGGALVLYQKRKSINKLIFTKHTGTLDDKEKMKFCLAAYNAGEKTISDAYTLCGIKNAIWEQIIKKEDKEKSGLWQAIPENWGKEPKYKEITDYVEQIISRRYQ